MSGHSKWSQIKHKKAASDSKKGVLFSKLVREIMLAAQNGGVNPETNSRLRTALEKARSRGLPKDNIERVIKRVSGEEKNMELQEIIYEAAAPSGVTIIIEGITDNKNRTLAEIKHILTEHGARLANPGALLWNFEKVGELEISTVENKKSLAEIELAVADSGASDFKTVGQTLLVETNFSDLDRVHHNLEKQGIKIKETGHDYRPRSAIEISPAAKLTLESLLNALTEHNDVQKIYVNFNK